jgi:hypothetical protein
VRGLLDPSATLGGPAAAAVLLAVSGPATVFEACTGASLLDRTLALITALGVVQTFTRGC